MTKNEKKWISQMAAAARAILGDDHARLECIVGERDAYRKRDGRLKVRRVESLLRWEIELAGGVYEVYPPRRGGRWTAALPSVLGPTGHFITQQVEDVRTAEEALAYLLTMSVKLT